MKPPVILVSECLLGLRCTYDGHEKPIPAALRRLIADGRATLVPFCPEQLGGLPTPRPPSEIACGGCMAGTPTAGSSAEGGSDSGEAVLAGRASVLTDEGRDVTEHFIRGAEMTLQLAGLFGAALAVCKENSPSCGTVAVHDGSFGGRLVPGRGVAAARLAAAGIPLCSERNLDEALAAIGLGA